MKLTIKITKDVLQRSMMCCVENPLPAGTNCAVALAVRDVFPAAGVGYAALYVNANDCLYPPYNAIPLPRKAREFIYEFDRLVSTPQKRLGLPEFSFEIDVPEEVINEIGISEIRQIIENSPTLELSGSEA